MTYPPARLQGLIVIDSAVPNPAAQTRTEDTCLADTLRRLSRGPETTRFAQPGDSASALFCRQGRPGEERWDEIRSYNKMGPSYDTSWLPADVPALLQQLQQEADDVVRKILV